MVVNTVFNVGRAGASPVRPPIRTAPRSATGGVVVTPMARSAVMAFGESGQLRRAADEARRELESAKKELEAANRVVESLRDMVRELDEDGRAKDVRIEELSKRLEAAKARNKKKAKKEDSDEEAVQQG